MQIDMNDGLWISFWLIFGFIAGGLIYFLVFNAAILADCEYDLPRSQSCILTAVPKPTGD